MNESSTEPFQRADADTGFLNWIFPTFSNCLETPQFPQRKKRESLLQFLKQGNSSYQVKKDQITPSPSSKALDQVSSWRTAGLIDPDEQETMKTELVIGNESLTSVILDGDLEAAHMTMQESYRHDVRLSTLVGESHRMPSSRLSACLTDEMKGVRSPILRLSVHREFPNISTQGMNLPQGDLDSDQPQIKSVCFSFVTIKFFECTLGQSVPNSGGAAIGLDWNSVGEEVLSVEDMEELRGGNLPEDEAELENEVWDDNWRMPREYFHEEGLIAKEKRMELLIASGHRRCSIDLNAHLGMLTKARRTKHSRSKVSKFIADGYDVEAMYELDQQIEAVKVVGEWIHKMKRRH
eukprot:CAMPEP_0114338172 /NCGR_PEP_ID=MMETSP0101-20121206/6861_1 /TAXON_ID=38822 ORGANISM="Pteridomonas danica, Strain PT" /NCGR_SAMPLE_ID=MMETSP0101 /ASSEMBLY_ACC=CAM_ASM_000211 /LENGTH=350 /DNA_ID=CAMNT_0001470669 /DNA_START=685 /DNA_END=1737 /DNA_ORIENTATION=+